MAQIIWARWAQFPGKEPQVKRKRYPRKFQRMAVERMRTSDNVGELARAVLVKIPENGF